MTRKLLIAIPALLVIPAIFNLIGGDFFGFCLWLFALIVSLLIVLPIIRNHKDQFVPIQQIIASLILPVFLLSIASYYDLLQVGFSLANALFLGLAIGLVLVMILMMIQGQQKY